MTTHPLPLSGSSNGADVKGNVIVATLTLTRHPVVEDVEGVGHGGRGVGSMDRVGRVVDGVVVTVMGVVDVTGVPGGATGAVGEGEDAGEVTASPGVDGRRASQGAGKVLVQPLAPPGATGLSGGSCQSHYKH